MMAALLFSTGVSAIASKSDLRMRFEKFADEQKATVEINRMNVELADGLSIDTERYDSLCKEVAASWNIAAATKKSERPSSGDLRVFNADLVEAGTLEKVVGDAWNQIDSLVVSGPMNSDDCNAARDFAVRGPLCVLNLENASFADNTIPFAAFCYISIDRVILPNSVETLGTACFEFSKLRTINLPESLKKIDQYAFCHSSNLEFSGKLPEGLTELGEGCFKFAFTEGSRIELPSTLKVVPDMAFESSGLSEIIFAEGLESVGKAAFSGMTNLTEAILPHSCRAIHEEAFSECDAIKTVRLPDNLHVIAGRAFSFCGSLEEIYIPGNDMTLVDNYAFWMCTGLRKVTFGKGVRQLRDGAFSDCPLIETIILPKSIVGINSACFESCADIKSIYSLSPVPPRIDADSMNDATDHRSATASDESVTDKTVHPFKSTDPSTPVYVPVGSADAYRQAWIWSKFTNIIETDEWPLAGIDTPVAGTAAEPVISVVDGNRIVIDATDAPLPYAVYSIDGRTAASGLAVGTTDIHAAPGIYIVRCGRTVAKLAITQR